VCYGDGKFVAVANGSNKAAYSTDGITWIASTLPSNGNWSSMCYGNGRYVAIAYNSTKAAYSSDGITWTASTLLSSAYWHSVCYGNGKFVAVANGGGKAAYSTDGITWIASTLPSDDEWQFVCYGDGKYVAVGFYALEIEYTDGDGNTYYNYEYNSKVAYFSKSTLFNIMDNYYLPKATLVTLSASSWDSTAKTQSVTVAGITADESTQMVIPMPTAASMSAYNEAGILCTGQGANTLTFTAETVPTDSIQVYVTYQAVAFTPVNAG